MKIAKNVVVSMAYLLRTDDGMLIDSTGDDSPLEYLHGYNSLIPGLEKAVEGHTIDEELNVTVPANEAYGEYNENLVQRVPKGLFEAEEDAIHVGMRFVADTDQGPIPVEVTEVGETDLVIDANHPLAGKNLQFHVKIISLREATEEEISHGHIHGAQGDGSCCGGESCDSDSPEGACGSGSCGCKH